MSNDSLDGSGEAEAPSHLSAGFLVGGGRYTLLRQIAKGGMGVVWLAHDERLNESVALKFLSSTVRNDPVELGRLRQETQKSRKLTHANIIRIYDLYEAPGEPAFISMEYVNGPNLWESMTQQPNGIFAWTDLKPLVKQLCDALSYAHDERVIHRDLKPTNLMLAENQRIKLADFGLAATALQADPASVERRFGGGTLTHMSPQQLAGEVAAVTDDIYSLGATLYDLLCGQPPFYEGNIAHQVRHNAPPPLQERLAALNSPDDVPPEVAAMIMACLAKEPSNRPQSVRAVADWTGLADVNAPPESTLAFTVFDSPTARPLVEQPAKSGFWRWLAVVGGLACIGLVFWLNRRPPPALTPPPATIPAAAAVASNAVVAVNKPPLEKPQSNSPPLQPIPPITVSTPQILPDPGFEAGRGADGEINDLALQSDGGILVAGHFDTFDGIGRRGLVRLKSNGKLDYLRADIDGAVHAIAIQPDGRILIAGDFTSVSGLGRPRLARLEPNLTLDTSLDLGSGPDKEVDCVLWAENKIFLGGAFQHIGESKRSGVARLDASGHIDPTFKMGPGANGAVLAAAAQPDGKTLIGGKYTRYHRSLRPRLSRIHPDGADQNVFQSDVSGTVRAIVLQRDGKILIAGEFETVHKANYKGIARLNPNGSLDTTFNPGSGADRTVETIALQSDDKIIIGGDFNAINGIPRDHLARLNPDGSLDPSFSPRIAGTEVRKVLVQRDGKILAACQSTGVEGTIRASLVRLMTETAKK